MMTTRRTNMEKKTVYDYHKRNIDLERTLAIVRQDLIVLNALREKNIEPNTLFKIIDVMLHSITETLQKHIDE